MYHITKDYKTFAHTDCKECAKELADLVGGVVFTVYKEVNTIVYNSKD